MSGRLLVMGNVDGTSAAPSMALHRTARTAERSVNIDLIKGALVLTMVVYHCASASVAPEVRQVRGNLSFLHYSFLIISGYLCGIHYFPQLGERRAATCRRLVSRAGKIAVLFLMANVAYHILGLGDRDALSEALASPVRILTAIFVTIDGSYVAFEVLWYISLFLLLVSVLFRAKSMKSLVFSSLAVVGIAMFVPGQSVVFLSIGCIGLVAGMLASQGYLNRIYQALLKAPFLPVAFLVVDVLFLRDIRSDGAHCIVIPLRFVEACSWFYIVVWILPRLSDRHRVRNAITLMGQYTLLSYLAQMPCARIASLAMRRLPWSSALLYLVSVAFVLAITYAVVLGVHWGRRQSRTIDAVYVKAFS